MHAQSTVMSDLDSLHALRHSRPKGMISLTRFLRRFGYDAGQLEAFSRMPPGSVRANPFAARVQRFMQTALEIVALRMLQSPDLDAAIRWFKESALGTFGGRTPQAIVAEGHGRSLIEALARHTVH